MLSSILPCLTSLLTTHLHSLLSNHLFPICNLVMSVVVFVCVIDDE